MILKKLKQKIFVQLVCACVLVLFVVRLCQPEVNVPRSAREEKKDSVLMAQADSISGEETVKGMLTLQPIPTLDFSYQHQIVSVPSFKNTFPDLQEVQYPAALAGGVLPVENRIEAEHRKKDLLFVGANPYYTIDPGMNRSIPYLVPKASHLLQHIGRRFLDSLAVKNVPLHTIIVTSVLRTEEDVRELKRVNGNVSDQSCHRFGTTFDISYNRFHTVAPPEDPNRRAVRNDSLKFILSEVLRDVREDSLCYVKYEVKQGCFHVTVR